VGGGKCGKGGRKGFRKWKRVVLAVPVMGRVCATFSNRMGGIPLSMDPMFKVPDQTRRVPAWRLILIMGLSLLALLLLFI